MAGFAVARFAVARFAFARLTVARFAVAMLVVARFVVARFAVAKFASFAQYAVYGVCGCEFVYVYLFISLKTATDRSPLIAAVKEHRHVPTVPHKHTSPPHTNTYGASTHALGWGGVEAPPTEAPPGGTSNLHLHLLHEFCGVCGLRGLRLRVFGCEICGCEFCG